MSGDNDYELEEVAANVMLLIAEELDVQHRLGEHPRPAQECPVCRAHTA